MVLAVNSDYFAAQNLLGCTAVFLIGCRPTIYHHESLIALKMEAARTCETSVDIQLRTWQYIPEDSELHTRRHENLKSHRDYFLKHLFSLRYGLNS
jgi:hypothetical protein